MSALANILVDLGHEVRGADYNKKYFTEDTLREKIIIDSFKDCQFDNSYFYIIGNAFKLSEVTKKIKELEYNFMYYPEFLESFFNMKKIGVTGSHGKTTTTFLASQMISKKINVLVGDGYGRGVVDAEYFLFEACEYQNHFLNYSYEYLVILNIDYDHPDFFKNKLDYAFAFQKAALKAEKIIVNYDDINCRKIVHKNKITFGFNPNSDVVMKLIDGKLNLKFDDEECNINFDFHGKYMAYNLAASFIVSYLVDEQVKKNIKPLKLPVRRMTEFSLRRDLILVNDYAHHPTEITAVLNALKNKYEGLKLVVIYQGHTHSRTKTFCSEYVEALNIADEVYIMPTFSSVREEDFDSWLLADAYPAFKRYSRDLKKVLLDRANLVIAFLGAGDIDSEFNFFK